MQTISTITTEQLTSITGGKQLAKCVIRPKPDRDRGHNTGITGGMDVPNNDVPRPER